MKRKQRIFAILSLPLVFIIVLLFYCLNLSDDVIKDYNETKDLIEEIEEPQTTTTIEETLEIETYAFTSISHYNYINNLVNYTTVSLEERTTEEETTSEISITETPEPTIPALIEQTQPPQDYAVPPITSPYPVADYVWNYLIQYGFSPAAAAGVIGNMMAECGACTLNLVWNNWNKYKTHYGLCQWATKYAPTIINSSLEYQMGYLVCSMPVVLSRNYQNGLKFGYDYNVFIQLTDPGEAATIFCREYEQCGNLEAACRMRASLAWQAYTYYMGIH